MMIITIALIVGAYLLGSVPSAVLVGKGYYGLDVREHGSMSAGATNTFRVLGKKAGTIVLIIDILKGLTAANLILLYPEVQIGQDPMLSKIILGVAAVLGHLYPVFSGFRGGKGIATLLGVVIALHPLLALGVVVIFLLVQLATNMVSAGSIVAAMSFSVIAYLLFKYEHPVLLWFGLVATLLVLYTHRANVVRIINGTEKKIYLFGKKD